VIELRDEGVDCSVGGEDFGSEVDRTLEAAGDDDAPHGIGRNRTRRTELTGSRQGSRLLEHRDEGGVAGGRERAGAEVKVPAKLPITAMFPDRSTAHVEDPGIVEPPRYLLQRGAPGPSKVAMNASLNPVLVAARADRARAPPRLLLRVHGDSYPGAKHLSSHPFRPKSEDLGRRAATLAQRLRPRSRTHPVEERLDVTMGGVCAAICWTDVSVMLDELASRAQPICTRK
jgi:hypothetical protein